MRAVHRELSDGRVIALLRDWKTEPQWLQAIHTRHRQKSRLLRAFVEHLAVALNDAA